LSDLWHNGRLIRRRSRTPGIPPSHNRLTAAERDTDEFTESVIRRDDVYLTGPAMTDATRMAGAEWRSARLLNALREIYGLTWAEAEVLAGLVNGLSVKKIAQARHVSVNTARAQLKSVMSKTGTNRQVDLIRLVYAGPAA